MDILTLEKGALQNLAVSLGKGLGKVGAFAASELAGYLGRAFSLDIPVIGEGEGEEENLPLLIRLSGVEEDKEIKYDGFRIAFAGNVITISAVLERGLLNGVYTLLFRNGFRWGWRGKKYEVIPELTMLAVEEGVTNPDLEFRGVCIFPISPENVEEVRETLDFLGKNRFNLLLTSVSRSRAYADDWQVEWNLVADELYGELEKRGMILNISEHSGKWFLPRELFTEHPDWFAMDEKGIRHNKGQLCYSNEEAVEYLKNAYVAYAKDHKEVDILGTWPEDGYGYCQCEKCKSPGVVLKAVNRIARKVGEVRPDLTVEYLSYTNETSNVPPELVQEKNVITLVSRMYMVDAWKKKSDQAGARGVNLLHYGISDNTAERGNLPLRIELTARDCKEAVEHKVRGIIPFHIGLDTWFRSCFNLYFFSRFSWESTLSPEEALKELCAGYYGEAAEKMTAFFRKLENLPRVDQTLPSPWDIWQNWPELEKEYEGDNYRFAVKKMEEARESARGLKEKFPQNEFLLLSLASAERFIHFEELTLEAWHNRALAVKAFRGKEEKRVKEYIRKAVQLEESLLDEVTSPGRKEYGVSGAWNDYHFFHNWRIQLDEQLYNLRDDSNKKPFMDLNPSVADFLETLSLEK